MTYEQLIELMESRGCNLAEVAIGRMMDIVEEETGRFPDFDETAPEWVINNCL